MKRLITLGFLLVLAYAGQAKKLQAYLNYATFFAPKGAFIETYLSVEGNSVVLKKLPNGKYQGAIEAVLVFKKADKIVYADKFKLLSPEISDTTQINFQFVDQHRVALEFGEATMELKISDVNNVNNKAYEITEPITIRHALDKVTISDIELLDSYAKASALGPFSKSGYDLVPRSSNYFPEQVRYLKFYAEIYNADQKADNETFLVQYYIQNQDKQKIIDSHGKFYKEKSQAVVVVLGEIPIENLSSGNYNLVIEAKNKKNELLATSKYFFQRNNTLLRDYNDSLMRNMPVFGTFATQYTDKDTLKEYLSALRPICISAESEFLDHQLALSDIVLMQKFLYHFWDRRNPEDPYQAWLDYKKQVEAVNNTFGCHAFKGYESDRGRVYLQYGAPNIRSTVPSDPNLYPYEIWHYYTLTDRSKRAKQQSNRKFVFYNRDLVSCDYKLIQSTALGEVNNNQWRLILKQRDTPKANFDVADSPKLGTYKSNDNVDNFESSKLNDLYDNPH